MQDSKFISSRSNSLKLQSLFKETTQQFKKQCNIIQKNLLRRKNQSLPRFNAKRISWYHQNLQTFNKKFDKQNDNNVHNHKSYQYIQGFFQNSNSRILKAIHQNEKQKSSQKQDNLQIQKQIAYPQLLKMRFNLRKKTNNQQKQQKEQSHRHTNVFNLLEFGKLQECQNKQMYNHEIEFKKKLFVQNLKIFNQEQIFENRWGACIAVYDNIVYQFCGQGIDISGKYIKFNQSENDTEIKTLSLFKRINNSYVQIKNYVIIYGGQTNARVNGLRNLNDLVIFDLYSHKYIHINDHQLMYPEKRNHISFIYKSEIYLWGGQNNTELDNILYKINLLSYQINKIKVKNLTEFRTRHKSVQIGDDDVTLLQQKFNKTKNQYKEGKKQGKKSKRENQEIRKFSVYIFGGMNENQMATNTMLIFRKQEKGQWIANYPSICGMPPQPRIDHCLVHYKPLNSLVICGGRNLYDKEVQCDTVYNDMYLFNLATYCYINIKFDTSFQPRYNFNMFVYNQNLLILGGLGSTNYMDNKIHCYKVNEQSIIDLQILNKSIRKRSVLYVTQLNQQYISNVKISKNEYIQNKYCTQKLSMNTCMFEIFLFSYHHIFTLQNKIIILIKK